MFEWKIEEEEARNEQPPLPSSPPVLYRRWTWPLLLLLVIGAMAGGIGWKIQQKERALHLALAEVVEVESRVQALPVEEQIISLADPDAPVGWRYLYLVHMSQPTEGTGKPSIQSVRWAEEGKIVLVEVVWPHQSGAFVERRAYRLTERGWVRTPLPSSDEPLQEQRTEHFAVRAPEPEFALATTLDLEDLLQHLEEQWPKPRINAQPITVLIQPQEFGPAIEHLGASRTIRANTFAFSRPDLASALPADAQYRLILTEAILFQVLLTFFPENIPANVFSEYLGFQRHLVAAEARHRALDERQRQTLREQWRQEGGVWVSPFSGPLTTSPGMSENEREEVSSRRLATDFLLDYLIRNKGREIPGQLASQLDATPEAASSFAYIVEVTGISLEELESQVHTFALTPEP
ncbi:MAG: hypothetical protein H0T73_13285 [Ardenticatenales bacterium]|nr:hypothetical protein [Ardenticatenales bacterium]